MHPSYCLDQTPRGYHLFLTSKNFQINKKLGPRDDSENRRPEFLVDKDQDFYQICIIKRQQKVEQNGAYLN